MDNPFKKLSSISPQKEKGSRRIATDIFNALIKARLSGPGYQVVMLVISLTWGYNKPWDEISLKQFMAVTGLSKPGTINTIKTLEASRLVIIDRRPGLGCLPVNLYQFNKYYDTWLNQTGKLQFTTLDIRNINKFYAQKVPETGKPQLTTSSPQLVNQSLPVNAQTGKVEHAKLVKSDPPKLVKPALPNNIKKSISNIKRDPKTKKLKSTFAEKTQKDMKGKKPLKLGKSDPSFEPF